MSMLSASSSAATSAGSAAASSCLRALRLELRQLERYAPPFADRSKLNLSLNEHYAPPSPQVQQALRAVDSMRLVTYDTELGEQLRARLAAREGVDDSNVLLFAGSSSGLQVLFSSLRAGTIALPSLCWTYHRSLARLAGLTIENYAIVQHTDTFAIDEDSLAFALRRHDPVAALFINPHMPTGALTDAGVILRSAEMAPDSLILVDEAYHGFSAQAESLAARVLDHPNLLVSKTLSKHFGLAGIRIGYLIASAPVVEQLTKACLPFSVPFVSARLALAALDSEDYYRAHARQLMAIKDEFARRLAARCGVRPFVSHGNFLLVEFATPADAQRAERAVAANGILVRSAQSYGLPHFLRISIGDADAMDRVAAALEQDRHG
jgi:histidinol-phosphate aminotransferase